MTVTSTRAFGVTPAIGFAGWLADVLTRISCYRRLRQERDQLLAMGERDLRDIGISRVDAFRIANTPARDVCGHPVFHPRDLRSPQL